MERKQFLKSLGWSTLVTPVLMGCKDESNDPSPVSDTDNSDESCTVTPSETAGPFPTKSPSTLIMENITSDRSGIAMSVKITVQNSNNGCEPLSGAVVDVWHCDKDGYYSEYGGTGMQQANFTSSHFLRGRQTTNADGQVGFTTIFPGWYSGRAPHIHVHIYDANGKSLLVTQIAFPTSTCDTVYTSADQFYTKGKQDTSNISDNIFADSLDQEMSTVTGSVTDGFELSHRIVVAA
ncbi:intradiol ring-cleavage dioxygenase [Chryseolinea sp. T2]|uniref:dioxygenase family protein n=1 Tax=Chryseolinea sp. T2 TaxID=3129255 RepID=UPI003076B901